MRAGRDGISVGEDYTFCLRAKDIGARIFVHTGIALGHVRTVAFGERDYRALLAAGKVDAGIPPGARAEFERVSACYWAMVKEMALGTDGGAPPALTRQQRRQADRKADSARPASVA